MMGEESRKMVELAERYSARNYNPLPIVITEAQGVWVTDVEGKRHMDMLSAYSALNHGHRHPVIIKALHDQADKVTLVSRAFHNDAASRFYEKLSSYTGKSGALAMNTGAEAVETAIKAARRWAYRVKGIPENTAEIIVCEGNFHGRTVTAASMSSTEQYRSHFGPFTPGFKIIPYGDLLALEKAITSHTAAFLVEPIQGEAGVIIPPSGYLARAAELCRKRQVLLIADEIQTGFGRTGRRFAVDWEGVTPDIYILGKALGGGVMPISAIAADEEILGLFEPGSHGSTFGGNPLACAVATAAIDVTINEGLAERSEELGEYMTQKLKVISSPVIKEIRGRGLFIGIELTESARPYCEQLMRSGLLCKETHDTTIRIAPPLIVEKSHLDWALDKISDLLNKQPKRKKISVIKASFGLGGAEMGAENGPDAITAKGLTERLSLLGWSVTEEIVCTDVTGIVQFDKTSKSITTSKPVRTSKLSTIPNIPNTIASRQNKTPNKSNTTTKFIKHHKEVQSICQKISQAVSYAVEKGEFPLLLGGDHSVSIGSLAGLVRRYNRLGVIWLDAHGDINTEDTSPTGNAHGMVLSIATGLAQFKLTDISDTPNLLQPGNIVLVGARDLDEGEKDNLSKAGIRCFTMSDIDRLGISAVMSEALSIAREGADGVHLSLDMDVLDPREAPEVGTPVPGGLTFREARFAMELLSQSSRITSMDVVEVNPKLDGTESKTAELALRLIETLFGKRLL
ncbi:ornithine--oxo-acid transaminase [Paenibacillus sp. GCM10027627]|uniref:ornithine--oxo-acid transaminase n=1 Tax=unclassified Paenibacillus TaxID=185978 RepID=UPI003637E293